jgi:hypothetical protein
VSRVLVSASRRNNLFQSSSYTRSGGFRSKAWERKVREPEDGFASTRDACATLRQRDALEGADDVVGTFFGEEAFVIAGAEVPVRTFVIIVAKKPPDAADHNDAAHPVVPVIADVMKTQIRAGVGTLKSDMVIKHQLRQPGNFLGWFKFDLAERRSGIAKRAEAPFHVDDAPVIG